MCIFIICSTWIIGSFHVIPLFWYEDCYIVYSPSTWQWSISSTKCGITFKLLILQYLCEFVSGLNFLLNFSTWILIQGEKTRRHPVESRLLKDELWRSLGFFVAVTVSNIVSGWAAERWQKYILTCILWQTYHLFDG
uniref:7TM_GPCR_Srx domain-containing protein n=1 Tax=Caenorhabditis tropicalis TaxID=1561998 RepID=A0A1I7TQ57_9PELO